MVVSAWTVQVRICSFYNITDITRDYRNVGSYMHESHVNDFFCKCNVAIYRVWSRHKRGNRQSAILRISPPCGHHICHPYVHARIGHESGKNSAYVYGMHAALENDIDTLFLLKYKKEDVGVQSGCDILHWTDLRYMVSEFLLLGKSDQ